MNERILTGRRTPVVSVGEMRRAERAVIEAGASEDALIERASDAALAVLAPVIQDKRTLVVCGAGNNGSDGLSLALKMHKAGFDVRVMTVGDTRNAENSRRLAAVTQAGLVRTPKTPPDVVVDAVFGIGLSRPVEGKYRQAVRRINDSRAFTAALDIASGLDADTGAVMGEAVRADLTVAFSAVKRGSIVGQGLNYSGRIVARDIGIPVNADTFVNDCFSLAPRPRVSHKGNYGRVYIIAGCPEMAGAAVLAAYGALYAGAGYVTLCVPASMTAVYAARIPEVMLYPLPDENGRLRFSPGDLDRIAQRADAILIGNGLGVTDALRETLAYLFRQYTGTLVIDADGLNALAGMPDMTARCTRILTPHIGELYRLTDETGDVTADAARLAVRLGCVVAAKSAYTAVTDGKDTYLNLSGCAGMAKGGSGDALAGIVTALAVHGAPLAAAAIGCYRFGLAGEAAEEEFGSEACSAMRILNKLRFPRQ